MSDLDEKEHHFQLHNYKLNCQEKQLVNLLQNNRLRLISFRLHVGPQNCFICLTIKIIFNLDQLAKPVFRSRYAHTPFGSAPVPILLISKQITNFVMRSKKVCQLFGVLTGRAKILFKLVSHCLSSACRLLRKL